MNCCLAVAVAVVAVDLACSMSCCSCVIIVCHYHDIVSYNTPHLVSAPVSLDV